MTACPVLTSQNRMFCARRKDHQMRSRTALNRPQWGVTWDVHLGYAPRSVLGRVAASWACDLGGWHRPSYCLGLVPGSVACFRFGNMGPDVVDPAVDQPSGVRGCGQGSFVCERSDHRRLDRVGASATAKSCPAWRTRSDAGAPSSPGWAGGPDEPPWCQLSTAGAYRTALRLLGMIIINNLLNKA